MNKRPALALALALALPLALPVGARAADIGYVDMQQVRGQTKLGMQGLDELRKAFAPKTKPLDDEEQAIRQLQAVLQRDAALMSKEQVAKKETEIKKRIEAFLQARAAVEQEVMKAQQDKVREFMGPAMKAVDAVAKQKKLGMVLERSEGGILYVDKALDITAEVVKQINAAAK